MIHRASEHVPDEALLAQEVSSLLADCGAPLLQYARSLAGDAETAADAVQEAALRYVIARRKAAEFDNPRAWMFRVARHYVMDQHRRRTRQHEVDADALSMVADSASNPEQAAQEHDFTARIVRLLSPRERTCVGHRIDGLSYEDIARAMGVSANTVGVMLSRASKKIQAAA